jgi:hypothetical protein
MKQRFQLRLQHHRALPFTRTWEDGLLPKILPAEAHHPTSNPSPILVVMTAPPAITPSQPATIVLYTASQ